MRALPLADPGTPDHRSPARFLVWLMRSQVVTLLGGIFFGVLWMSAQAVLPAVIGRAIDAGVTARDTSALLGWAGALLAVGSVQVVAGIVRHRFAVTNWLAAAYTTVQVVTRQVTRLGAELPRRVSTGEVVAIGSSDIGHLGHALDVTARASGAVVSIVLVAVILFQTSLPLALLVLAGVPALLLALGPLLAPLQRRTTRQRELTGSLTNLATDIVGGLRVLLGIGGERVFHRRYVER
ncbi:ABC transporter transmembrane domain-containing protein, partial [Nocardioides massiliensis]